MRLLTLRSLSLAIPQKMYGVVTFSTKPTSANQFWRNSATILIAKPTDAQNTGIEYLMTARSDKAKFMPGGLCFPGGAVSPIDSSKQWIDLYKKLGQYDTIANFSCLLPNAHKPQIYTENEPNPNLLSSQISYRITAIRETFEECGLLLCKPAKSGSSENPAETFMQLSDDVINEWQRRVKTNPDEFLNLCQHLQCLPSLHSLSEWNDWLTPRTFKPAPSGASRRFDTIFYMTILPRWESPKIILDPDEVGSCVWSAAAKLIKGHNDGIHALLPPQLYEMGRLSPVDKIDDLKKLVKLRQEIGIERWCPYLSKAKDGIVGILPGDDLLPKTWDKDIYKYCEMGLIDKTLEELEKSTIHHHRWQMENTGAYKILINHQTLGHVYSVEELEKMKLQ